MQLSIIIPALNEARRLPHSLAAVYRHLAGCPELLPAEVVVVDDGSNDDTVAAARAVERPGAVDFVAVRHERNRGKGAAVRSGFARSRGRLVLLSDADLATPIEDLATLMGAASGGVAIGSRAVDRRLILIRQPWYRDLMGRGFNLLQQTLGVPGVNDTQCGFKLFPGELARALAAVQRLDGFAFDVELLVLARHWGWPVREVGVHWRHVEESRVVPLRHSAQMLRDLVRLGWWRLTRQLPSRPSSPAVGSAP